MRRFLLLLAIFISASAWAQDYKILFLNTESIKISGKHLKEGDTFRQTDKIQWSDDKQAMWVWSSAEKKQILLVARSFKEKGTVSIKDYFVKTNRMSTRGAGSLSSVARKLGDTIYTMGPTPVAVDYIPDTSEYFFLMLEGKRHQLEYKDDALLFTPDIWADKESVEVDIYYHYADGEDECISEGILIVPIPEKVSKRECRCGK